MKKLLLLGIILVCVIGVIVTQNPDSKTEYLKVDENEINDYLTKHYLSNSSYEKLETYITGDKLICYVLLKNNSEGVLLQLTKNKSGYNVTKNSIWNLSEEPISLIKVSSNPHTSTLQAGIVTDKTIDHIKLVYENKEFTEFTLNRNKGFIVPIKDRVKKVELFDKNNNLVWSYNPA